MNRAVLKEKLERTARNLEAENAMRIQIKKDDVELAKRETLAGIHGWLSLAADHASRNLKHGCLLMGWLGMFIRSYSYFMKRAINMWMRLRVHQAYRI
jgi:hypothetical protein